MGLTIGDVGLWELNEAFACQALYCRDHLGIDPEIFNVNGGGIGLGHPFGMTGSRLVGSSAGRASTRRTLRRGEYVRGGRYGRGRVV